MESLVFIVFNSIFYAFIYYVLHSFELFSNQNSAFLLLGFSLIISLPSIILMYILKKDRVKFFTFSSIWTIFISFIFLKFGLDILKYFEIKEGLANFTMYIFSYLFMFSPLLSLFFLSMHKTFNKKKQLFLLIAFKYLLPIILGFICMNFFELSSLLWLFAIVDILTTANSLFIATLKF